MVRIMRQLLSEKVIPKEVRTDNGPHFNGQDLQEFARELAIGFEHITSSSHYPRSYRFIESQVKSVRSAVMKSKTTKSDPNISLPCPRATFVDHKLPSLAELLLVRPLQDNLPRKISRDPSDGEVNFRVTERQQPQKYY